jgi:hypothetical protein
MLQFLLALKRLRHDFVLIEVLYRNGDAGGDGARIKRFFEQTTALGFADRCVLLLLDKQDPTRAPASMQAFGRSLSHVRNIAADADILWNFAGSLNASLLALFKRRAYIDIDPGLIQISALSWEMNIDKHEVLFTVGLNMHGSDCKVPTLGRAWHVFFPCVELSSWNVEPDPGFTAPFSSITQWNWEEYEYQERVISISKRAAYLRYVDLPRRVGRNFELAANIGANDVADDRALLEAAGWRLADPHEIAGTVQSYKQYIFNSRAELSCPKPIYRELKTGWLSDRTACDMAAGRPVLAEDTGISALVRTDRGMLTFSDMDTAVSGVLEIDSNYRLHSRAAREFAAEYLDAQKNVARMLELCFAGAS